MADTVTQVADAVQSLSGQSTAEPQQAQTQAAPQTTQQAFEDQLRAELGLGANVSTKALLQGAATAMAGWQEGQEAIQRLKALEAERSAPTETKPAESDFWGNVEWDDAWLNQIEKTQDGYRAKPGADPALVQKVYAGQRRKQEILDRLARNPSGSLQEMANKLGFVTKEQLQEMLTQTVAQQREITEREACVRDNWDWMVQKVDGQIQHDGQGRPILSEKGRAFFNLTQALTPESMKDWNARAKIAQMVIQGMFPEDKMHVNQAPRKTPEQERAEALVNASRSRAPAQAPVTSADQSQQGRSDKDRLAESLGIGDNDSGYEVFARLLGGR